MEKADGWAHELDLNVGTELGEAKVANKRTRFTGVQNTS